MQGIAAAGAEAAREAAQHGKLTAEKRKEGNDDCIEG
jgi:hypothetical protein